MQYDPIKRSLGKVFNRNPFLRILFYRLLDILLLRSWYIRRELRQWKKIAPKNANILDAGSGFGQYVWRMSQMGKDFQITGVDVKQEQIEDCNLFFKKKKLHNRITFKQADLTKFSEPKTYHLILSVDVMEHIAEDEKVMSKLNQSLKSGGMLIISTPSDQGGSDTHHHHQENQGEVTGFIDEHVRDGYNATEIKEKLKRAGFTSVKVEYSYGKPGNIAWKLSMKYPIIMLNKSKLFFILLPFYYLLTFPVAYVLNHLDVRQVHQSGTGLIVKAIK
ncbi:class I SAM-dependent methyltransferase [Alkalitalea saponilacus]|uniref:Methyltransferase domain-containing protein n=1 Tax=Alkalitalea saponilacus TaxID=889453 RepID=A0A1T5HTP5_9BACT|nr:class I SAM-dependent methyltransferase [Alkalitalea saponilacus]ASB49299.1 methyltransferase type 11 [Alkalitalea saponilacus]SKC24049.1 Methyltransferase domain-containing protein [Alkalitalea saponilacus]